MWVVPKIRVLYSCPYILGAIIYSRTKIGLCLQEQPISHVAPTHDYDCDRSNAPHMAPKFARAPIMVE